MKSTGVDSQHDSVDIGEQSGITGPQYIPITDTGTDPPETSDSRPQFRFTGGHETGNDDEEEEETDGQETDDTDTLALLDLNTILGDLGGGRGTVHERRVRNEIRQIEHRQRDPHTGHRRVFAAGNRNHGTGLDHGRSGKAADIEGLGQKVLHRQCQNRDNDTADGDQDPRNPAQRHTDRKKRQSHRVRKIPQNTAQYIQ